MSYNIANLKTDLQALLSVNDLTKISAPNELIQRAARDVLADSDPYETVRDQQISVPIHKNAYYYPTPSDLKGDGVLDIYKQGDTPDDNGIFGLRTALDARAYKHDKTFAIEKINGVQYIRVNKELNNYYVIDRMSNDANYTAVSNVSNIDSDNVQYIEGSQSISFDLDNIGVAGTASISGSFTQADLTKFVTEGSVFLWQFLPNASDVTQITLRIGSGSSDYYSKSVTTNHSGNVFESGWNLLRFDLSSATETGTVDIDAVDYFQLTYAYDGTEQKKLRIDYMTVSLGQLYNIKYYSKFLFRNTAGTWSDAITGDTDLINLDTDSYNLLLYKCASYFIQHQHDFNYKATASESDKFEIFYQNTLKKYRQRYKSERMRQTINYYPY